MADEKRTLENSSHSTRQDSYAEEGTVSHLHSGDVDAALQWLEQARTHVSVMTEVDERKLIRKIDWMIVPLMWLCYNLQYLDKTLINYANVMGLQQDAGFKANQFSILALAFYVTYLVFEFPTGYLMQRLPTAKYLGANVILWGLIVTCTCASKNFVGLITLRVLLGVFESCIAPSLILITSMWYKRSEQPPRMGFWYVGTGTAPIIGSLASYGFQHYTGKQFTSWQIMFLLFGLITIVVGICVFIFLPDNPMTAKKLTTEEKVWSIERLRENKTGVENKHFKAYQMRECFLDPQTWLISLITISSNIPNGAVSSYQGAIIQGFGYTSQQTALLSIPSGVVAGISVLLATWLAGRYRMRAPFIVVWLLLGGVLGGCLLAFSSDSNKGAKLTGNYLTNMIGSTLPLLYSYSAANYAGHTKKVTMNAVLLISFCLGNILGPLSFTDSSKPAYIPAKITIVATSGVAVVVTCILAAYYHWENKRRDRVMQEAGHKENSEFYDLTDRENPEFRYQW